MAGHKYHSARQNSTPSNLNWTDGGSSGYTNKTSRKNSDYSQQD